MSAYRQEAEHVAVASVRTAAEAQLVQMTLVAAGIQATTSASDLAHPSLDFVQGVQVFVAADDAEEARALLGGTTPAS